MAYCGCSAPKNGLHQYQSAIMQQLLQMSEKSREEMVVSTPKKKPTFLDYICPCLNFKIFQRLKVGKHPSTMTNTEQQSHATLPEGKTNARDLPVQLLPAITLEKAAEESTSTLKMKQSKVDINIKGDLNITINEDQSQFESMQKQYDQYLHKHKEKQAKKYPAELIQENRVVVVGNARGKMLCRVKSVVIQPSQSAIKKQREADKHQEKSSDPVIQKYWDQRYLLFDKFDEGIKLDQQSWYSVTPEAVAEHVANRLGGMDAVLDGFCGAGGDSIKLGTTCKRVYSNDIEESKIKLLINNAAIYGIDNIHPSACDFFTLDFKRNDVDAVYLAPPWGGIDYHLLQKMQPEHFHPSLSLIINKAVALSDNIALLLPANTDIEALAGAFCEAIQSANLILNSCSFLVEKIYFRGSFKFVGVWFGARISGVNLGDELEYIYRLLGDGQGYFRHRRVVKKIREACGMVNLLNYIFECQKVKSKTDFLFQKFIHFLISRQLITSQKLEKLELLEENDTLRQGKGEAKRNKTLTKSMLSKEMEMKGVVGQKELNVSCVGQEHMARVARREIDEKIDQQTVSYVSSMSQAYIIGSGVQRESLQSTEGNGVKIQEIEESNRSGQSER